MPAQPSLNQIFFSFLRLGFTAFGGPAMIENIRQMAVARKGWLDQDTFRRGTAFCQAIPGATAMQTVAFTGLKTRGFGGASAAFIGFGLPAFLLMCLLSYLYGRVGFPIFVFNGMRLAVIAIIFHAAFALGKSGVKKARNTVFIVLGLALFLFRVHPVISILSAAIGGLVLNKPALPEEKALEEGRSNTPWKALALLLFLSLLVLLFFHLRHPGLFTLCLTMARIDLMAFGGGFASVPLMYHEVVERLELIQGYDFINGIALGQITPGPLIITATFVGYLAQSWPGAIAATFFVFLPSFVLVCGLAGAYEKLARSPRVKTALDAVFLAFVGLIAGAGVRMILQNPMGIKETAVCVVLFGMLFYRVPTLCVVLTGIGSCWILFA